MRLERIIGVLLVSAGCSETSFTQLTQEDFFQQNPINTVDLLIVVDNSCSMIEEQSKLSTNFDSFIQYFDEAEVDWQIGVITTDAVQEHFSGRLIGGDDELLLLNPDGRVVDQVVYDKDWPVAPGVVFSLDSTWYSVTGNESVGHWCTDLDPSPGADNGSCGGTGSGANPDIGALLFTEFLPDPDGVSDTLGEWVELTNISEEDHDSTGYALADDGRNLFDIPDGTLIAAGQSMVFGRSPDSAANGGVTVDVAVGDAFTLNNHDLFLSRDTTEPEEIFAEMVAQGISGVGMEMGFEGARMALSEPLLSGENAGFLREEATLSLLIVSDEEDASPLPIADYLNFFTELKGEQAYRDHRLMNISAVVGDTEPEFEGGYSCSSDDGVADFGSRYVHAARETDGLLDSICDEDFSPIVEELGLTLSGLEVEFALSRVPVLSSLDVSIYADETSESKIRDLTLDVDYSYVEERNAIRFEYDQVPESQQYILAEYTVQSGT